MAAAAEEAAVARIAAAQHGVVTARQLHNAGFGRNAIARRLEGEWLVRVHEGVYQVGVFGSHFAGEMAALLACGPWSAIGRRSAVAVHGLPGSCGGMVDVTIPHEVKAGRPGIRYHRVALLPEEDVTVRHGLRVTTPARTLVDLAASTPPAELERLIEEIQVQRLATPDEILEAIRRGAGRPGIRKLRAAADLSLDEPLFTRSEAERRLRRLVRSAALPTPRTNVKRAGWEVDAVWDRQRLVVEVDGYRYHRTRAKFERDRRKDAQLMLVGYRVLRITWRQLTREPETVIATIAAALVA
jgi:very-short-patch-repair endonuclease